MKRFILVRFFYALIAIFFISVITFGLARISGNPVDFMLDEDSTQADYDRLVALWGLDRPLHIQYLAYVGNVMRGNFGESLLWRGRAVRDVLLERLPNTLQLAFFALLVSASMALPIGVIAAVKKDTGIDYAAKIIALLGQSLPSFWLGIVLIWIFAVHLGWFPTSGRGGLKHMVLPAIALGWFQVAAVARLTRSSMLEVLDSEYVKLARVKGLSETKVVWKHCLRNAALVPITYFGIIVGGFVTGSVVIETVFAWPGLGLMAIEAVRARDYQVVQSVVIFFACVYVVSSLVVDITYAYLDPRIRFN